MSDTVRETCGCGAVWEGGSSWAADRERFRSAHARCRRAEEAEAALSRIRSWTKRWAGEGPMSLQYDEGFQDAASEVLALLPSQTEEQSRAEKSAEKPRCTCPTDPLKPDSRPGSGGWRGDCPVHGTRPRPSMRSTQPTSCPSCRSPRKRERWARVLGRDPVQWIECDDPFHSSSTCQTCKGRRDVFKSAIRAGEELTEPCPDCNGTGRDSLIHTKDHPDTGGRG